MSENFYLIPKIQALHQAELEDRYSQTEFGNDELTLFILKINMNELQELQVTIAKLQIATITIGVIIGFITSYIALQQFKVNQEKLRLDLYTKRFEIYSKIMDLYIQIPKIDFIYNNDEKIQPEINNHFDEFKKLNHSFTKCLRESMFLFDEESKIYSNIKDIHNKFSFIAEEIPNIACLKKDNYENKLSSEIVERQNEITKLIGGLEKDMLELEKSLKHYLYFPSYFSSSCIAKTIKYLQTYFS